MTTTIDFAKLGTLSPEDYAEQQALSRKQRLAQMLLNQGSQAPSKGQMVNGIYVAPNFFELLAPVAQAAAGKYMEKQADTEALDYAQRLRKRDEEEMKTGLELWRGTDVTPANKKAAADFFMTARGQNAQALGRKLLEQEFKEPEWKETTLELPNGTKVQGQYNKNAPSPMATFIPFTTSQNVPVAEAVHKGIALPNIQGSGGTFGGPMPSMPQGGGNMPISMRNNNPGNLVDNQGQFRQFPTMEAGQNAMIQDLTLKLNGQSPAYQARFGNAPVTPITLAETWSPMNEKGNSPQSTVNYAKKIAQDLGVDINTPLPNDPQTIQRIGQSITQFEAGAYTPPKADRYKLAEPVGGFGSPAEKQEWFKNARQPLTGEPLKEATGNLQTIRALDEFEKVTANWHKGKQLSPDEINKITAASKNALLALKDAKRLGVLNKEDLPQLEALIKNPSDLNNILISRDAILDAARKQQIFARDNVVDVFQLNQKEIPTYVRNQLETVDRREEEWAKNRTEKEPANKNVQALRDQGKPVAPKTQDVTQIKQALTQLGQTYDPVKYEYRIVNGRVQSRER